jgi:gag-polypeptide of LTR copia-type
MTEETKMTIPKLAADGANWVLYKDRMLSAFGMRGLSDHIDFDTPTADYTAGSPKGGLTGEQRWKREEHAFRDLIGVSVPDSVYLRIKGAAHAKDMWSQLKGMFEGRSRSLATNAWRRLTNTRCKEGEDI